MGSPLLVMEAREFPVTRISIIEALASDDSDQRRAAADLIARAYWLPIVTTLRIRWHLDLADAEDLTQEFLAEALLREWLVRYDPARALSHIPSHVPRPVRGEFCASRPAPQARRRRADALAR